MSQIVHLTLSSAPDSTLRVSAETSSVRAAAQASAPVSASALSEQVRGGSATPAALRAVALSLGEVLFAGDVGELLRALIAGEPPAPAPSEPALPALTLALTAGADLVELPWELAADPRDGVSWLAAGREILRVEGAAASGERLMNDGLVLAAGEQFRVSALKAATAQLRRRFHTRVEPVETGAQLGAAAGRGRALLCHIYALDRLGRVTLDGEPTPLGASPAAARAYLLNLSPMSRPSVAREAREAGAAVVFGRQINLSVKESADADRAIYQALGAGLPPLAALSWARAALRAQGEPRGEQRGELCAASLTLTSAPPSTPGAWGSAPALEAFPPPSLSAHTSPSATATPRAEPLGGVGALQLAQRPSSIAPLTPPSRVPEFVHTTIRLIQQSQREASDAERLDLALRTGVMKQLSALAKRRGAQEPSDSGLTRGEVLTQQLIAAARFPDAPLTLPPQWFGVVESLARESGVRAERVAQAAQALVVGRALWLWGGDAPSRLRVARGLCELAFSAYPLEVYGERPLHPALFSDAASEVSAVNGGLWEVAQLSWAQGSLSPFDPSASRPSARSGVVAFHPGAESWQLYSRAWLVVDQAYRADAADRYRVARALREGVARGYSESGRHAQVHLPQDLRVIYLSDLPPEALAGEVVVELRAQPGSLADAWTRDARARLLSLGLSPEEAERRLQAPGALSLSLTLSFAAGLRLVGYAEGLDALCYAALAGGGVAHAEEAAELYLSPLLRRAHPDLGACVREYAGRADGFEARWEALARAELGGDVPEPPVVSLRV